MPLSTVPKRSVWITYRAKWKWPNFWSRSIRKNKKGGFFRLFCYIIGFNSVVPTRLLPLCGLAKAFRRALWAKEKSFRWYIPKGGRKIWWRRWCWDEADRKNRSSYQIRCCQILRWSRWRQNLLRHFWLLIYSDRGFIIIYAEIKSALLEFIKFAGLPTGGI